MLANFCDEFSWKYLTNLVKIRFSYTSMRARKRILFLAPPQAERSYAFTCVGLFAQRCWWIYFSHRWYLLSYIRDWKRQQQQDAEQKQKSYEWRYESKTWLEVSKKYTNRERKKKQRFLCRKTNSNHPTWKGSWKVPEYFSGFIDRWRFWRFAKPAHFYSVATAAACKEGGKVSASNIEGTKYVPENSLQNVFWVLSK